MQASRLVALVWAMMPLICVAEERAPPSLALLEYLGEWQDEEGHEIDPQALAMMTLETMPGGGESDDEE